MDRFFILIIGFLAAFLLFSPSLKSGEGEEVIYCWDTSTCSQKPITYTVDNCEEWWPGQLLFKLDCERDYSDIESVSMVADPANHITADFYNASYTVNNIPLPAENPWDLEFLPDGTPIMTDTGGKVYLRRDGDFVQVGEVSTVNPELVGLMGLAVHPNFTENRYIYLYYTEVPEYPSQVNSWGAKVTNKLVRFRLEDGVMRKDETFLTVGSDNIHSGGRLEFGPDGKLYLTTGEAHEPQYAQRKDRIQGKILRLNPNGTVPGDNPFNSSYVYSRGHRNPQGLAWHPRNGWLYASEHGPWRYDEVNRITAGSNYGWAARKCESHTDKEVSLNGFFVPPVTCFRNWTLAPSGMAFVDEPEHPWYGNLFVAGLRSKHLHMFDFQTGEKDIGEGSIFWVKKALSDGWDSRRVRDVEFQRGKLWVLGDTSGMAVLEPERVKG